MPQNEEKPIPRELAMQYQPWMRTFNTLAENQPDRLRAASQLLSEILEQHAMRQPSHSTKRASG